MVAIAALLVGAVLGTMSRSGEEAAAIHAVRVPMCEVRFGRRRPSAGAWLSCSVGAHGRHRILLRRWWPRCTLRSTSTRCGGTARMMSGRRCADTQARGRRDHGRWRVRHPSIFVLPALPRVCRSPRAQISVSLLPTEDLPPPPRCRFRPSAWPSCRTTRCGVGRGDWIDGRCGSMTIRTPGRPNTSTCSY